MSRYLTGLESGSCSPDSASAFSDEAWLETSTSLGERRWRSHTTPAARRRDIDDLRILIGVLRLTTVDQVTAICSRIFPDEPLPDPARLALEDLFEE